MKEDTIIPAVRASLVQEYYFSRKLKQIAAMRQQGLSVINLGIGSPDLPPSDAVIDAHRTPPQQIPPTTATRATTESQD